MSVAGLALRVAGGALLACSVACAAPPTGNASTPAEATAMAPDPSHSTPARPAPPPPPPRVQPGAEVAGSRIGIPPAMRAGSQATAQVPPGSEVHAFGQRRVAAADGQVVLHAPATPGTYEVRVKAPQRAAPLRVKVRVTAP